MGFDYASKIRGLLATADSHEAAGNEGAAASFRAKALEWMDRYRIAEEDALAEDPTTAEPKLTIVDLAHETSDISGYLPLVAQAIARHCEVRLHIVRPTWGNYRMKVVGYEGDVRYFEFLWTSAYLMFATRIDPVWDSTISPETNIHRLRRAGHTRKEIAFKAGWNGDDPKARQKVQRVYVTEAKAAGEDPAAAGLGFQAKDYRSAYAQAFLDRLSRRLREARDAANASGGVVVLAGRAERVQESFYTLVPEARPSTEPSREFADPTLTCSRCIKLRADELKKPIQTQRPPAEVTCRDHNWTKPRRWTDADEARWQRQQNGSSARAGRASGRQAADGVVLRGTASPTANRVEAANQALES